MREETDSPTYVWSSAPMSRLYIFGLAVYLITLTLLLICGLIILWPGSEEMLPQTVKLPPPEPRYLMLSCVAGALGGVLQALQSFSWYVGNRCIKRSWGLTYLLRPLIGMALGIFVYIALRGGLLKAGSSVDALNHYTVIPIIGFVGLFSEQVFNKLRDFASSKLGPSQVGLDSSSTT